MEDRDVTEKTGTDSVRDIDPNVKKTENDSAEKSAEKPKKKVSGLKVLQRIFIAGIIVCVIILGWQYWNRQRAKSIFEDLQNRSTETAGTDENGEETSGDSVTRVSDIIDDDQQDILAERGIEIPEKNLDWDAMREQNSDIYAWIYVPGTSVDYPVLQKADDDDYYLKHNLDGSSGYPGCIYTQTKNSKDFTDYITVLYGHNMKDGTMFKSLHNYSDSAFFENNRYIFVYTPEKVLVYEIFAAVRFGNGNVLLDYDMNSKMDRTQFISDLVNNRSMTDVVDEKIAVDKDSHIITLSTCLDDSAKNRWLVNGVLIE
jgi:sortase B